MGHRTDEKRYANARLECCPDCGAIWACLSTGSMLWREAPTCALCRDGVAMGRKRIEARQQHDLRLLPRGHEQVPRLRARSLCSCGRLEAIDRALDAAARDADRATGLTR